MVAFGPRPPTRPSTRPSFAPISGERNAAAVLLERGAGGDLAVPAFEVRHLRPLRDELHVAARHHADRNIAIREVIARDETGLAQLVVENLAGCGGLLLAG